MSEEDKKIVIVVGAGASCDFIVSEDKKFNENHGNIKYEIWGNPQTIADKDADKNAKYFLSEKNRNNYSFPSGEALIKMIGNTSKIAKIFLKKIINDNRFSIFIEKLILENENKEKILDEKYSVMEQMWVSGETTNFGSSTYGYSNLLANLNPGKISAIPSQNSEQKLRKILKIKNGDNFDVTFLDLIVENFINYSPYLQISRLVKYYQPFSIDELLDSIKTNKIDILEPLKIKKEDLKAILKSSEEDSKKLEKQFRNELINAGKTLIALFLLQSEKRDLFDNPNPQNDAKIWYRHIRNLIINSAKDSAEIKKQIQNLTIISFNYDRSLDYYLRTRLSDYYAEIKERIFYPYGKLAEENWDCDDYGKYNKDGKFNPYNDDELREIEELGQGLRVIGELDEEVVIQEELDEETREKLQDFQKLKKGIELISQIPTNTKFTRNEIKDSLENQDNKLKKFANYLQEKNEELSDENPKKKIIEHHQKDCEFLLKRVGGIYGLVQSDKLYFLGFAFHQANCNLLGLNQLYKINYQGNIYYTNFDESESINNAVKEIFIIGKEPWKLTIHESKRKGVYDALMHDFKLGF
jgi:hypothetical protein